MSRLNSWLMAGILFALPGFLGAVGLLSILIDKLLKTALSSYFVCLFTIEALSSHGIPGFFSCQSSVQRGEEFSGTLGLFNIFFYILLHFLLLFPALWLLRKTKDNERTKKVKSLLIYETYLLPTLIATPILLIWFGVI